jgi:hypothetical protein
VRIYSHARLYVGIRASYSNRESDETTAVTLVSKMMSGTAVDAGAPAAAVPATVKVVPEKKDDDDVPADHSEYQYAMSAHAHTLARPPHSLAR